MSATTLFFLPLVIRSGSMPGPPKILKMCKGKIFHDASGMIREDITKILSDSALAGKTTIRLHDGDPSIYGAIREQMDSLKKMKISSDIVPGVTSFLASAAALGTQLTLPGVTQTIIVTRAEKRTKVSEKEAVAKLATHGATMVFYLSVHLLDGIVKEALKGEYKKDTPAAIVYRASWNDQKIILGTLQTIASKVKKAKITKTAIIIIGEAIDPQQYEFSKLYDKEFSHGYRKANIKPKKKRAA